MSLQTAVTRMSTEARATRAADGLTVLWVSEWAGSRLIQHEVSLIEHAGDEPRTRLSERFLSADNAAQRFHELFYAAAFDDDRDSAAEAR